MRIAILEDDPAQTELLTSWITDAGHEAYCHATGAGYLDALRHETFDLLIVDWNLPDITGPEVLGWVRENIDWHIPVLFMTSRDSEADIVLALEQGADDYMVKPVKQAETLARIHALERRAQAGNDESLAELVVQPFAFDLQERRVIVDGEPVELTNKEFELAVLLFRNIGRLMSRSYLLEKVWGTRAELNTRTVDTHVSRVRNKLGIRPQRGWRLSAVYQHGYRLEAINGDSPS